MVSIALLGAACGSVQPSPTLDWRVCAPGGVECAGVDVPADYAAPQGRRIRINLGRLPATGPGSRLGSLVIDFGGPAPALTTLMALATNGLPPLLGELRGRFDLVAFNRRGFDSDHEVRCFNLAQADAMRLLDLTPDDVGEEEALLRWWREAPAACQDAAANLDLDLSSATVARDLDTVRAALGDARLTFLGMSYGTLLGAQYASQFPGNVRAIVLDAPIDPDGDPITAARSYAAAGAMGLDRFLSDCAARSDCAFRSNGDPWTAFDLLLAGLDAAPLEVPGSHALSEADVLNVMRVSVASEAAWPVLASGLAAAADGDGRSLLSVVDWITGRTPVDYRHLIEQSVAITCADVTVPADEPAIRELAADLAARQPRTRAFAWNLAPCLAWPTHGPAPALTAVPADAQTVVVIGSPADPQTPYVFAERMASRLGNAVLLTLDTFGHTMLGRPEPDACVEDLVVRYLVDEKVPTGQQSCGPSGSPGRAAG